MNMFSSEGKGGVKHRILCRIRCPSENYSASLTGISLVTVAWCSGDGSSAIFSIRYLLLQHCKRVLLCVCV